MRHKQFEQYNHPFQLKLFFETISKNHGYKKPKGYRVLTCPNVSHSIDIYSHHSISLLSLPNI